MSFRSIVIVAALLIRGPVYAASVAITIDDFVLGDDPLLTATEKDERILDALGRSKVQAALFVVGGQVEKKLTKSRLRIWDRAGHLIANHTYSHPNYHKVSFQEFSQEILKVDFQIRQYKHFTRLFRFPGLKAGNTADKRDRIQDFLEKHGYKNGHVTIDASDWYVNERLIARLKMDPNADLTPYREFYLRHIWERSQFYDALASKVLGREMKHTLLIHHNLVNALFLEDLLHMFREKGWKIIDAASAFSDPVFDEKPRVLPAGESVIWSLAKATGKFESILRYPGEDGKYEKAEMDRLGL